MSTSAIVSPYGHARVQRGVRVLEHDLDPLPQSPQRRRVRGQDVHAVEQDASGVRLHQAQDRSPGGRLAAAGLADQRQRLASSDGQADAPDRRERGRRSAGELVPEAARLAKDHVQVVDTQQRPPARGVTLPGSWPRADLAGRSARPRRRFASRCAPCRAPVARWRASCPDPPPSGPGSPPRRPCSDRAPRHVRGDRTARTAPTPPVGCGPR